MELFVDGNGWNECCDESMCEGQSAGLLIYTIA